MDRRSFVVGGGAAVAATLGAAAVGQLPAAAAAVRADAAPMSTGAHARLVLGLVDSDQGLVDPGGMQSRFAQNAAAYQSSMATQDPDGPSTATGLDAWAQQRMVNLCGTDNYVSAVTEVSQTRTLLAFGLLTCSQAQDVPMPQVTPGMPVPAGLDTLEPDFFPVLLNQIADKTNSSPSFANAMRTSMGAMDQMVAQNTQDPSGDGSGIEIGAMNNGAAAAVFFGVFVLAGLVYTWIRASICYSK
jgi:hypothetical protein